MGLAAIKGAYVSIDLSFTAAVDGGYRVDAKDAAGHGASGDITMSDAAVDLGGLLDDVRGTLWRDVVLDGAGATLATRATTEAYGAGLYEAVFGRHGGGAPSPIGTLLHDKATEAKRRWSGLRLRLDFSRAPELARLPWEYLTVPGDVAAAIGADLAVVRTLGECEAPVRTTAPRMPLRMLQMIYRPDGAAWIDADAELRSKAKLLAPYVGARQVEIDRVEPATTAALHAKARARNYHVFHFVGHGEKGALLFQGDDHRPVRVTATDLLAAFEAGRLPWLAILNSCWSAGASRADAFSGVAQTLVRAGVPAAIAMQFPISDRAAQLFIKGFYTAIASRRSLEAAVTSARRALLEDESTAIEWGTPVLYTSAHRADVFELLPDGRASARRRR